MQNESAVLALENKYREELEFVIVDVRTQEGSNLGQQFGVEYIPMYFILNGQGQTASTITYPDVSSDVRGKLEAYITKFLGENPS